jgi:NADH-quinone oxidoreductase subunit J
MLAEIFVLWKDEGMPPQAPAAQEVEPGVINQVAAPLFREYLLAFEVTSILLLAAIVGAVVLAKRKTA